jgi:hypothetical protein
VAAAEGLVRRFSPKESLIMYRVLSVGLLVGAVAVVAVLPALKADDKPEATSFMGKVSKIDTTKRLLTLTDVRTAKVEKTEKADKEKNAAAAANYQFEATADAKITLDGTKADLKDLKEGYFARVWPAKGEKITTSDTDKNLMVGKTDHVEAFTKAPPEKDK